MKYYESKEFAEFIEKIVIPGNGDNYYCMYDDGIISEFTDAQSYTPGAKIKYRVQRDPSKKSVQAYINYFKQMENFI